MGSSCHAQTGQCHCLPGVSGSRCQQCAPGYWGFSERGCRSESCFPAVGSLTWRGGTWFWWHTHLSNCQRRKTTNRCLFGVLCVLLVCTEKPPAVHACTRAEMQLHSWSEATYSPPFGVARAQNDDMGVSLLLNLAECECRGGSCDPRTGECTCSNGLTGKQCDVCMHNYEIPVANGPDSMRCEGVYPGEGGEGSSGKGLC